MAAIRKFRTTGGARWQAIVRRKGETLSRAFPTAADAKTWAVEVERAIDRATADAVFSRDDWLSGGAVEVQRKRKAAVAAGLEYRPDERWTLREACSLYRRTKTKEKKGERAETNRLLAWEGRQLAQKRLNDVTTDDLEKHVANRQASGRSASTIAKEIMLIRAIYKHAADRQGWGLTKLKNPAVGARLPAQAAGRQRRLQDAHGDEGSEEDRMRAALADGLDGEVMVPLFDVALETGMRLGELLDVRNGQVKRQGGHHVIERPDSKNGHPRRVTLSTKAEAAIRARIDTITGKNARLFEISDMAVQERWRSARRRAGIEDLRFHDLRHEALSRMAGKGLTLGELQAQSGHKSAAMLLRYINARPADIAKKLG